MREDDPITIVLVDDSLILRSFLSRYLSGQGFLITLEADNGLQFLTALRLGMELPDMCLLDANMPVMNGYETARQLRAGYPSIQIMAFSYLDDDQTAVEFIRCGADQFTCKDVGAEELRDGLKLLHQTKLAHHC